MNDSEWEAEQIAEVRKRAQEVIDASDDGETFAHSAALDAFDFSVTPDVVLSLLDALESARAERDEFKSLWEDVSGQYHETL